MLFWTHFDWCNLDTRKSIRTKYLRFILGPVGLLSNLEVVGEQPIVEEYGRVPGNGNAVGIDQINAAYDGRITGRNWRR